MPTSCRSSDAPTSEVPTRTTVPALTAASAHCVTARRYERATANSTGPVKKAIALAIPATARSLSASAPTAHSGPINAISSSLHAARTSMAGIVNIAAARRQRSSAACSAARLSCARERTVNETSPTGRTVPSSTTSTNLSASR